MTDKMGSGRIDLRWTGVEGEYSFGTALKLIGELTCEGFPRAVSAILFVTIRADDGLKASKSFQFGTATPIPFHLVHSLHVMTALDAKCVSWSQFTLTLAQ